jgi:hypothetical protein
VAGQLYCFIFFCELDEALAASQLTFRAFDAAIKDKAMEMLDVSFGIGRNGQNLVLKKEIEVLYVRIRHMRRLSERNVWLRNVSAGITH